MGKKKIKTELEDAEGGKYNLSLEGNISKEKIMKVFEMMELLDVNPGSRPEDVIKNGNNGIKIPGYGYPDNGNGGPVPERPTSIGAKISLLVESKFPYSSFTSSDLLEIYEDEYNEPIKLSIISTYLSRYSERGRLSRLRQGKEWVYRLVRPPSSAQTQRHLYQNAPSAVPDPLE